MNRREYYMDRKVARLLLEIIKDQRQTIDAWDMLTDARKKELFRNSTEKLAGLATMAVNWRTKAEQNGLEIPGEGEADED
jgi:predicted transposase YdaD